MRDGQAFPEAVELRDAATVMLLRDGSEGLEVFMLRRNLNSDFVGGAYVFPGGGVDDHDRHANLEPVCEGRTDADSSARLGVDRGGLAYFVAAIRESFEEAGVLLAYDADGSMIRLDEPGRAERFAAHRRQVDTGGRRLVDVCAQESLRLAVDTMFYFSHWITPEGAPRRYDTRFFVARAPEGQAPLHDDREVIANLWILPTTALERYEAGEYDLIFPTIRTLETLARFATTDEVLEAAAAIDDVPTILPRIVLDESGQGYRIVLPGDAGYDSLVTATLPPGVPMNAVLDAATATAAASGAAAGEAG
jgi:8-oxo-dGTP pyrophosphatase MutT (NUDIX family)